MKQVLIVTTKDSIMGGNERFITQLFLTLQQYNLIVHVKYLTVDETSPQGMLQAYAQAKRINTKNYDIVFSTKFPAYCVKHPLHINLHNHWFKRLYVDWKLFYKNLPASEKKEWRACRRKVLQYDKKALHQAIILAQSQQVQKRLQQKGIQAKVLTPPPIVFSKEKKKGKHFLIASMLDNDKKRIDFAIRAYQLIKTNYPLIITGTGKDEEKLKTIAKQDKRIKFVGVVSDEKLKQLYRDAIATIHVGKDEDFGLSVAESLASGCAVITCYDSGGTVEQVIHEVTGIICSPEIEQIGSAIEQVAQDNPFRKQLEQQSIANKQIRSWKEYVEKILTQVEEELIAKPKSQEERHILDCLASKKPLSTTQHSWQKIISLAEYHGILPYVFVKVKNAMPITFKKEFQKKIFIQQQINNFLIKEHERVTTLFKKNNIKYLNLKGINVIKEKNTGRKTSDIDILIRKRDKQQVKKILLHNGFLKINNKNHQKKFFEEQYPLSNRKEIGIEIKTKLDETMPVAYEQICSHKIPETLFCFHAHHATYKHPFRNLKWLHEGKVQLEEKNINVQKVMQIAQQQKIDKSVTLFFMLLKHLFNYNAGIFFTQQDKKILYAHLQLHNQVSPFVNREQQFKLERINRVLLSQNRSTKIKTLYRAIIPEKGELLPFMWKKRLSIAQQHLKEKAFLKELWRAFKQ